MRSRPNREPHVFGDRVYIFGSHDKQDGNSFCEEDYVGWSASINDLGNWRCEGVIYKKEQDPINGASYDKEIPAYDDAMDAEGMLHNLYAPDVAQGLDGRYYLYYALDADELVNASKYERTENRNGYRSGHYERNFTTTARDVKLKVPKLKGIQFETAIHHRTL